MAEPIDEYELMAFADGELSPDREAAVRQHLAAHPEVAGTLAEWRRLDRTAERVIRQKTPGPPAALAAGIAAMAARPADAAACADATPVSSVTTRQNRTRRLRVAVAATILLALGAVGFYAWRAVSAVPVLPGDSRTLRLVADVSQTHRKCAKLLNHVFSPQFPEALAAVSGSLRQHLGHSANAPDLSAMGYHFAGAGPCKVPGGTTVHLLYRASDNGKRCISLFVQADRGQLRIDHDRAYLATGPGAEYAILVWRSDGLVFYLVGDDFQPLGETARQMGVEPPASS